MEVMATHYSNILNVKALVKSVTVVAIVLVWILIDKGNAAGQSVGAGETSGNVTVQPKPSIMNTGGVAAFRQMDAPLRSAQGSADKKLAIAQFKNGDPEDATNEESGTDFSVYPNPVEHELVFDFEFTVRGGTPYEVTDALGRLMDRGVFIPDVKQQRLDFSGYVSGLYLIKVNVGSTSVVKRIIKK